MEQETSRKGSIQNMFNGTQEGKKKKSLSPYSEIHVPPRQERTKEREGDPFSYLLHIKEHRLSLQSNAGFEKLHVPRHVLNPKETNKNLSTAILVTLLAPVQESVLQSCHSQRKQRRTSDGIKGRGWRMNTARN